MKGLTEKEAVERCARAGLRDKDLALTYGRSKRHRFFVPAPEKRHEANFFAFHLLSFREVSAFEGGLLWLRRWEIGSPLIVHAGWRIVENMRRAHGELRSLEAAPAQFFREDELVEMQAFLLQVMNFGWVAEMVPARGDYFLRFKDNYQICFTAKAADVDAELRNAFAKWNPTDEDPMVVKMRELERARKRLK